MPLSSTDPAQHLFMSNENDQSQASVFKDKAKIYVDNLCGKQITEVECNHPNQIIKSLQTVIGAMHCTNQDSDDQSQASSQLPSPQYISIFRDRDNNVEDNLCDKQIADHNSQQT